MSKDENPAGLPAKHLSITNLIITQLNSFMKQVNLNESQINLDVVITKNIAKRFWRDINRISKIENINCSDRHKFAGYLTHWIAKLKPIRVVNKQFYYDRSYFALHINELFALYVGAGRMEYYLSPKGAKISLERTFVLSFLFSLRNRITSGNTLSSAYYLIEQVALARKGVS